MSKQLYIRVSDIEFSQVQELAKSAGLPLATFVKTRYEIGKENAQNMQNFEAQMLINRELFRLAATSIHILYKLSPADKRAEILDKAKQDAINQTSTFFDGDSTGNESEISE
ncbi:hypothetical protein CAP31_02620 [Sulfuriferula sp. AH1]|uniref:hypothetical protein n=1 Tax=Sulfuriferula sp. AH1 TaxID=1985873 RepID=UPI000B3B5AA1|nr:hypothetical protein [Sulfuriferula sp. AH1]ARU30675.1 hypothetical protein CAP31_02620 [Sulfuriferula sp. AH1]